MKLIGNIALGAVILAAGFFLGVIASVQEHEPPQPFAIFGAPTGGDSLEVRVTCGGPDTLRVTFLGRNSAGVLFTRRPETVVPGMTLVMKDHARVFRGARIVDSRPEEL